MTNDTIETIADQVMAARAPLPADMPGDAPEQNAWVFEVLDLAGKPGPLQQRLLYLRGDSDEFFAFCSRQGHPTATVLREVAWRRFERPTIAAVRFFRHSQVLSRIGEAKPEAVEQAVAAIDACVAFYRACAVAS
jgi:hypothetical protein